MNKAALITSLSMFLMYDPVLGIEAILTDPAEPQIRHNASSEPDNFPKKSAEEVCFAAVNHIIGCIKVENIQENLGSLAVENVVAKIQKSTSAYEILQEFPTDRFDSLPETLLMPRYKGQFLPGFIKKYTNICKVLKQAKCALELKEGDLKALAAKLKVRVDQDALVSNTPIPSPSYPMAEPAPVKKRGCCFWSWHGQFWGYRS